MNLNLFEMFQPGQALRNSQICSLEVLTFYLEQSYGAEQKGCENINIDISSNSIYLRFFLVFLSEAKEIQTVNCNLEFYNCQNFLNFRQGAKSMITYSRRLRTTEK